MGPPSFSVDLDLTSSSSTYHIAMSLSGRDEYLDANQAGQEARACSTFYYTRSSSVSSRPRTERPSLRFAWLVSYQHQLTSMMSSTCARIHLPGYNCSDAV